MSRKKPRKTSRTLVTTAPASAYYLRSIPPDLWEPVMAKAKAEGRNIRWVILHALRDWLDGLYRPAQKEVNSDERDRLGRSETMGQTLHTDSGSSARKGIVAPRSPLRGIPERT